MDESMDMMIAATALNNMFRKGYFDICCVKNVAKVLNVQPDASAIDKLAPLHCIQWSDMPAQVRDAVPGLIQQALLNGNIPFEFSMKPASKGLQTVIEPAPDRKRALLPRWLGGRND